METLTDEIRKARKPHRCGWCGGLIPKGDKYRYSSYKDGGDMWSFREHLTCHQIFKVFAKRHRHYYEDYTAGFFEECVIEELRAYVCKECPCYVHPPENASARGKCASGLGWYRCIDKLYENLSKRGEFKEEGLTK